MLFCEVDVWADCLRYFGTDIRDLSGADAIMLAERIQDHVDYVIAGEQAIPRSSIFAYAKSDRPADLAVYDPDAESTITDDDDLLNDPELFGMAEVEYV